MKVPFINDTALADLHPIAVKILLEFCGHMNDGSSRGTVRQSAKRLHISERAWRRHTGELVEAGLIMYAVTSEGYKARPLIGRRFTWVPSFEDDRLRLATARCCKVLVAVCRAASNTTRSVKMRLSTIAKRIGRSVRTVQLGLSELAERCVLDGVRTGRSNWFCVRAPEQEPQLFDAAPEVAHRAGLILRLLSSSTPELLSTISHRGRIGEETEAYLRKQWIATRALDRTRKILVRELVRFGVVRESATAFALQYTPDEVGGALELAVGRRTDDPTGWMGRVLKQGVLT